MAIQNIKSFLGTGWSFPPVFEHQMNSVKMVSDEEDIRQSLILLLSTTPDERIMNPDYGCDLHRIMFQPMTNATQFLIKDVIKTAVLFYEPRITLDDIVIDYSGELDGIVYITLHYTIRKINIRSNIVFPFYKTEGTSVVGM